MLKRETLCEFGSEEFAGTGKILCNNLEVLLSLLGGKLEVTPAEDADWLILKVLEDHLKVANGS